MDYRARIGEDNYRRSVELAVCANDVVHWVNHWAFTYDPRETPATLPFDLFPRQEELLRWLTEREARRENGIVEKSRDMGLTWLCCAYALHGWLFRAGFAAGFGSRKLELVDRIGDPDSIFEKIRFLLDNLPAWMWPAGFARGEHDNYAKLVNPANGASITGEGGDNIGRGGRKSLYFVDESAFLEHPDRIERSLSQTTRCRIDVSTPNGPGNAFARRRHSGKVQVFTLHWRDDPRKGEAWYAAEKERLDSVTVAQEIDIDYTASIEGICIPAAWVRAAVGLFQCPAFVSEYRGYQPGGDLKAGLDVADEGRNRNVFTPRRGPLVEAPQAWGQMNTTQTAWKARELAEKLGVTAVNYDSVGVGAGIKGTWQSSETPLPFVASAINVGDPPTETRWPSGKSSAEMFVNLRAELWWRLRVRCEKAYEFREQGVKHRPEDMISLPDCPDLISDLSLPLCFKTETGKIQLESKKDMAKRGVRSPDFGDSLALTEAPARKRQWGFF